MRTSSLRTFSLALACLLMACSSHEGFSEKMSESGEDGSEVCKFGTSTAPGPYCGVSIFALISKPEKYYGKEVYTYGYLKVSKGGDMGLSYEASPRSLPDFFSCVDLGFPKPRVAEGVYSVAVYGRFAAASNHICAGKIEAPVIDAIEQN